jgi:hypothetical protein
MNDLRSWRTHWTAWMPPIAVVLLATGLGAQLFETPLTDADLARLLPLLKAEVADTARRQEQAERDQAAEKTRQAARQTASSEIASGHSDPLAWLQHVSPNAVTPSTARYDASCSRAVGERSARPAAVFSFGIPAPDSWLALAAGSGAEPPVAENTRKTRPPGGLSAETVAQQARAFYSSRHFDPSGERAVFEWMLASSDRLITATVYGVNPYRTIVACSVLDSGPTIVLSGAPRAFGPDPVRAATKGTVTLAAALEAAGLRDVDYQTLKFQVTMARNDARDPAALPSAPPGAAAADPSLARQNAVRAQNAVWYRRHAPDLDPLLGQLIR